MFDIGECDSYRTHVVKKQNFRHMKILIYLSLILTLFLSCTNAQKKGDKKPNIIYILADDAGYGDFGCYGQTHFPTPNIDKLAAEGMRFTQHYSGSTVCAPSRSVLMTGLHTGHTAIRGNKELKDREGQTPIPAEYLTIAEVLKNAGYATGAFGKWGLGYIGSEGDAVNQGFDQFFGYNCQRMAHRYYPTYLWDNQEKHYLEGNDWTNTVTYAPDVVQDKTLEFIEDNKDKPFFAYIPLIQPHAEIIAPDDSILAKFKGKFVEDKPYTGTNSKGQYRGASDYGPDIVISKYCSQEIPKAVFAAMMYRIDVYVGQIMNKLDELGIAENTIVMLSSDNGPHLEGGADPDFFNSGGGLRGYKRDLYEGGIRTPLIVKWPAKTKPGSVSNHVSAFWDVLPTCADVAGIEIDSQIDGISFLPTLTGKKKQKEHDFLYWEFALKQGMQAVRMGDWKGVIYKLNNPEKAKLELFNLKTDRAETTDVANQHPEIVAQIKQIMKEQHQPSTRFPLFKEVEQN